jgi:beta-lactamase class A
MKRQHGSLIGIDAAGSSFMLRFKDAEVPARIVLDADGHIAGLWFGPSQAAGDIATQVAAIKALPGQTSLLVLIDGKPIVAHEAETPLAVGSAAKLAILLAVKRAIAPKRLAWDQVVQLDPRWKSLPSGQLQDWPEGTPLTIATLAHLMISISDNTATDALIRLVGRDAVEAISPRNTPFPTTRELFTLKTTQNASLRAQWQSGDTASRAAILARIADTPLPPPDAISPAATHEIEWFMTARELCGLLDATADLPSLGINTGPIDRKAWQSIAYKGGSEVGVLNLSSRFTGKDGRVHCVVATWNSDGPLDDNKLLAPYRGLIAQLAMQKD